MDAIWIAIRNFLVLLALSWIGVSAAPQPESARKAPEPPRVSAPQPACGGGACQSLRPSFDAEDCG